LDKELGKVDANVAKAKDEFQEFSFKNKEDKKSTKKEIRQLEKELKKKEKGLNKEIKQATSDLASRDFSDWHI